METVEPSFFSAARRKEMKVMHTKPPRINRTEVGREGGEKEGGTVGGREGGREGRREGRRREGGEMGGRKRGRGEINMKQIMLSFFVWVSPSPLRFDPAFSPMYCEVNFVAPR